MGMRQSESSSHQCKVREIDQQVADQETRSIILIVLNRAKTHQELLG
jgi:hypothetical protein